MTLILRSLAILIVLVFTVASLGAAFAGASELAHWNIQLPISPIQTETLSKVSWTEVALWSGAGIFFLRTIISLAARLTSIRAWILGAILYIARWVIYEQQHGDLVERLKSLRIDSFSNPVALWESSQSLEFQVALLVILLISGLLVLIVHSIDDAYWARKLSGEPV